MTSVKRVLYDSGDVFLPLKLRNLLKQNLIGDSKNTFYISNCPYAEMFYKGFTNAYYMICREIKTKYIIIENISHNNLIVDRIHKNQIEISPTAFFLYNYVSYSFKPEKIFCIY